MHGNGAGFFGTLNANIELGNVEHHEPDGKVIDKKRF